MHKHQQILQNISLNLTVSVNNLCTNLCITIYQIRSWRVVGGRVGLRVLGLRVVGELAGLLVDGLWDG